jgi:hypothetical protein
LAKHAVDERGFAVIDVSNDDYVSNVVTPQGMIFWVESEYCEGKKWIRRLPRKLAVSEL